MIIQKMIEDKLSGALALKHLEVINESHQHNVPAGSESHFKLVMVADAFLGKKLIDRHREINKLLADELAGPIHALALHTYTEEEWKKRHGDAPLSPPCMGGPGSKA